MVVHTNALRSSVSTSYTEKIFTENESKHHLHFSYFREKYRAEKNSLGWTGVGGGQEKYPEEL